MLNFMRRCFIITITFVILSSFFILMHLQVQFYSTNLEDQNSLAYSYTNDSQKNHPTKQDQNLSESSKTLDIEATAIETSAIEESETSALDYRQFKVVSLDSPIAQKVKEFNRNQWPVKNLAFSDKVTPEYIQKLQNTKQCKRMVLQNVSHNSLMASFSRGRLANQLNTFALQYAIWKEHNIFSYFDSFQLKLLKEVFEIPDPGGEDEDVYFEWVPGCLRNTIETIIRPRWHVLGQGVDLAFPSKDEEKRYFDKLYKNIEKYKENTYIKLPTYITDLKRFYPYLDELKSTIFKFKTDTLTKAKYLLENIKQEFIHSHRKQETLNPENVTLISMHIRLTDYKKHLEQYYNMSTASEEYLNSAIDYMSQKYDNTLFYVLSDDIKASKMLLEEKIRADYPIKFPGNGIDHRPGLDMALLSLADHSIMTYGSFGMWGSLLAKGGETVLPKDNIKSDVGAAIKRARLPGWTFL